MTWDIDLEPYDVIGAIINSDQVHVETWRVTIDRNSYALLRQQVNELNARATMLGRADCLDVLTNPSFEQAADRLPGWIPRARDRHLDRSQQPGTLRGHTVAENVEPGRGGVDSQ